LENSKDESPKDYSSLFFYDVRQKKKEIYPKTGSTSHEFVDFFILKQYYFIKIGLTNLS